MEGSSSVAVGRARLPAAPGRMVACLPPAPRSPPPTAAGRRHHRGAAPAGHRDGCRAAGGAGVDGHLDGRVPHVDLQRGRVDPHRRAVPGARGEHRRAGAARLLQRRPHALARRPDLRLARPLQRADVRLLRRAPGHPQRRPPAPRATRTAGRTAPARSARSGWRSTATTCGCACAGTPCRGRTRRSPPSRSPARRQRLREQAWPAQARLTGAYDIALTVWGTGASLAAPGEEPTPLAAAGGAVTTGDHVSEVRVPLSALPRRPVDAVRRQRAARRAVARQLPRGAARSGVGDQPGERRPDLADERVGAAVRGRGPGDASTSWSSRGRSPRQRGRAHRDRRPGAACAPGRDDAAAAATGDFSRVLESRLFQADGIRKERAATPRSARPHPSRCRSRTPGSTSASSTPAAAALRHARARALPGLVRRSGR